MKTNVKVSISVSLTGGAGHMFFIGFVSPNYSGKSVQIQRRTAHGWKKIASATLAPASSVPTALGATARSKYRKRLRLKAGTYRAFSTRWTGCGSPTTAQSARSSGGSSALAAAREWNFSAREPLKSGTCVFASQL